MPSPLQDYVDKAEQLLTEKRYQESYALLNQVLEVDPEYGPAIRMRKRVENAVNEANRAVIDEKKKEIKNLIGEQKYPEALSLAQEIFRYAPQSKDLIKIVIKTKNLYAKSRQKEIENFLQSVKKELANLSSQEKGEEMLQKAFEYLQNYANIKGLRETVADIRSKWVEQELKKQKEFLHSEKYEEILKYLLKLENIEPQCKALQKALRIIRERYYDTQIEAKREFIYRGKEHLRTLLNLRKYEKALLVAQEILNANPKDRYAASAVKKCQQKIKVLLRNEIAQQIKENFPLLKEECKAKKSAFTKI